MASGRFLQKKVAISVPLNSVSLEADYLFTRCIPHLDREGRMPGHPGQVKGLAVPMRPEFTLAKVGECLAELAESGLVRWYAAQNKMVLHFPGFQDEQVGLRKDREPPSSLPGPQTHGAQAITWACRNGDGTKPEDPKSYFSTMPDFSRHIGREGKGGGLLLPSYNIPTLSAFEQAPDVENLGGGDESQEVEGENSHQQTVEILRAAILQYLHRGAEYVRQRGHTIGMGLEVNRALALMRKHGLEAEDVAGAIRYLRSVYVDEDSGAPLLGPDEPTTMGLLAAPGQAGLFQQALGAYRKAVEESSAQRGTR